MVGFRLNTNGGKFRLECLGLLYFRLREGLGFLGLGFRGLTVGGLGFWSKQALAGHTFCAVRPKYGCLSARQNLQSQTLGLYPDPVNPFFGFAVMTSLYRSPQKGRLFGVRVRGLGLGFRGLGSSGFGHIGRC